MTESGTLWGAMSTALAHVTTHRARTVLLLAGAVAIASSLSAMRLRPVASVQGMLGEEEPAARALINIAEHFAGMDELIVLVSLPDAEPTDRAQAADRLLAYANRLTDELQTSESLAGMCHDVAYKPATDVRRFVESVMAPRALYYLDDKAFDALKRRLEPDAMRRQLGLIVEKLSTPGAGGAVVKQWLKDPLDLHSILASALPAVRGAAGDLFSAENGFFSRDGRHLLIRVRGTKPASDLEFAVAFSRGVRAIAKRINKTGLNLAYAGAYAIAAESQRSIRADMIRSIVLSIIFLQVLYGLAYRNVWMLPVALAPVALGILVGFGVFAALGMNLSPITAVIGAILAGLGIDYTIHSLSHYQSDRVEGISNEVAIERTLRDVAPALIAACLTTVLGFLAISQSSVQALREFGWLGAMGLLGSLLAAILVLPSLLTVTIARRPAASFARSASMTVPARVLRHATKHRRIFLTLAALLVVTEIGYSLTPRRSGSMFENDQRVMHPQPNAPLDTQKKIAALFQTSPDTLLIYVEAPSANKLTVIAHKVRARMERLTTKDSNVLGSFGLASLLPDPTSIDRRRNTIATIDPGQVMANFDTTLADSPLNPSAFKGYRDFLASLLRPDAPPTTHDLMQYPGLAESVLPLVTPGRRSTVHQAITAVLTAAPLTERTARDATIEAIRAAIADVPGATLTGLTVVGHDTEHTIRRDLSRLLSFAALGVVLWLLVYFRSVSATILALIPVGFGFIVMLTCVRLFGVRLNTINLVALPLLVGVGVDDGIFLVTIARVVRARRGTSGRGKAFRETATANQYAGDDEAVMARLSAGCHAIVMTSLTTMLTFGTLVFTSTPAIQSLGVVMTLGVSATLVGAIWILAPVLTLSKTDRFTPN